jgi:hypothetical protein
MTAPVVQGQRESREAFAGPLPLVEGVWKLRLEEGGREIHEATLTVTAEADVGGSGVPLLPENQVLRLARERAIEGSRRSLEVVDQFRSEDRIYVDTVWTQREATYAISYEWRAPSGQVTTSTDSVSGTRNLWQSRLPLPMQVGLWRLRVRASDGRVLATRTFEVQP